MPQKWIVITNVIIMKSDIPTVTSSKKLAAAAATAKNWTVTKQLFYFQDVFLLGCEIQRTAVQAIKLYRNRAFF